MTCEFSDLHVRLFGPVAIVTGRAATTGDGVALQARSRSNLGRPDSGRSRGCHENALSPPVSCEHRQIARRAQGIMDMEGESAALAARRLDETTLGELIG